MRDQELDLVTFCVPPSVKNSCMSLKGNFIHVEGIGRSGMAPVLVFVSMTARSMTDVLRAASRKCNVSSLYR